MQSFIEEVVEEIVKKNVPIADILFVLPSKRAGTFLKNSLSKIIHETSFAPEVYSIENFIEIISGFTYAPNTTQLFSLYHSYLKTSKEKNKDSFLSFSKWGQTILQDFNEIDRYLVDTDAIFSHLSAMQELQTYLTSEKTRMIEDYIEFWNNLDALYHSFNALLAQKGYATQGYAYRIANTKIEAYISQNTHKKIIFIGFNALNKAEENIIQAILKIPSSEIYWDIDTYFLNDPIHDASYFIRQHQQNWPYFSTHSLKGVSEHYLNPKKIHIVGVPKNVSQAKYVGNLLQDLPIENLDTLKQTAIVLGDENLLNPILNAIPEKVAPVNITMGYPLHKTPLAGMFTLYFELWLVKEPNGWFYQHLLNMLSHPYVQLYLETKEANNATLIATKIKSKNWIYIKSQQLYEVSPHQKQELELLFSEPSFSPLSFLTNCLKLIQKLKDKFQASDNSLELEYLFRFHSLFNQLYELVQEHSFITDIKSLRSLYKELVASETLDFQGEPLQGTQLMGMLESRNLDFETVIITSVNEGILPSGKSNNSFIPFDIKKIYGLPTYKEKDAIYTYHFYRLLQRAKNIYLIYNTEPNVLEGNEKSRLLTQLVTDDNMSDYLIEITASSLVTPTIKSAEIIFKDALLVDQIKQMALKGFSPTSLSNYIRNPIDFYKKNILKINDTNEVEESVAANTFGTIVHDSLEDLYRPFIGHYLEKELLESLGPKIVPIVQRNFSKTYSDVEIINGKNLIAYHVIIQYIENFILLEIKEVAKHRIQLIALEQNLEIEMDLPKIPHPVKIRGKLDRIDEIDGIPRIVDYKTGKVTLSNVKVNDWEELIHNYDKSKAFQLLCYALLFDAETRIHTLKASIISFKNLNSGVLNFKYSDAELINQDTLLAFKSVLIVLIEEIFNPEIPFTEKEV